MEHRIRGGVVLLDDGDEWILSRGRWRINDRGYVQALIGRCYKFMHRELLGFPSGVVDHINGIKHDNRRCNLRACTTAENARNKRSFRGEVSFKGVTNFRGGYRAKIYISGKTKCLGVYSLAEDAARAYDRAAIQHFGEFACTNVHLGLLDELIESLEYAQGVCNANKR